MERLDVSGIVKMLRQIPRLKKTGEYAQFFYRGIPKVYEFFVSVRVVFSNVIGENVHLLSLSHILIEIHARIHTRSNV